MPKTVHVGDDVDLTPSIGLALLDPDATEIVIHSGIYREHLVIAPRRQPLLMRSATGEPRDVVISFGLRQGDRDRTGMPFVQDCATLTIDANDVHLVGITVENTFDRDLVPGQPDGQALALRTRGDRIRVERCRLLGRQDTVLLDAPSWAAWRRVHLKDCEVTGDVDFVYGRATALIEGGTIRSVGPGFIAAPSTSRENPRGFLFWNVDVVSDLAPGTVKLARPWHPGGKPDAIGQAIFADCRLGAHIASEPWAEMGGYAWEDARFAEWSNTGPGSGLGDERPQLSIEPDPSTWLTGCDTAHPEAGKIVIVSDSTASQYDAERAPRTGWGQKLGEYVRGDVLNLAISGASTRSFIESGALDGALDALAPGDLLLVGFGHNDPKPDERFSDLFTQFEANLRRFLIGARTRGATPVLLTPIERRDFVDGRARSTHGGYPQRVRDLARVEDVDLIDLTIETRRMWQQAGEEESKLSFLWLEPGRWSAFPEGEADDTHLSVEGADAVARLVAGALKRRGLVAE